MSPTIKAKLNRWTSTPSAFRVWAVLVIMLVGGAFIQAKRDQVQARHDRDARIRLALELERKTSAHALSLALRARDQAIRQGNAQFAFAVNSLSCGFRDLADQAITRAHAAAIDPKSPPSLKARNRKAEQAARAFRTRVPVTVPPTFDCKGLSKSSTNDQKGSLP